jgi:hypothetical protein
VSPSVEVVAGVIAVVCLLLLLAVAALFLAEARGRGGVIERVVARLFADDRRDQEGRGRVGRDR